MKTGRIYKIVHSQSDICYVGSTFNTLRDRWGRHKTANINRCSITSYIQSLGAENFKIILIKEYEVEDRKHLEAYEQLWINKLSCINSQSAFTIKHLSRSQYRKDRREELSNIEKERYYANREAVLLKRKERIQCDCGVEYTLGHKSRHFKSKKHTTNLAKV